MKKLITLTTLIFGLLFAYTADVQAQSESVNASATVIEQLTTNNPQAVDFATVESDLNPTPTIDEQDAANDAGVNVDGTGTVSAGLVTIDASGGADVDVTFDGTVTLTDGTNTMDYTPTASFIAETNTNSGGRATTSATPITSGTTVTLTATEGQGSVYFGGTLGNPSQASLPAGGYSGQMSVSVAYTNI